MRSILVIAITFLLIMDVFSQQLEAMIAGKALHVFARVKVKAKDKKKVLYGAGAVVKTGKGVVEGVIGKPLKVIGIVLGPLGKPLKLAGTVLKAKSVADKRSAFDQVSEYHRGRIVAYRDCGLSFREISSRVGRNQTVMRICDCLMQEGMTDRRGRSHPPQCTISPEWSVRKTSIVWSTLDKEPDISAANSAMKEECGWQNGMKLSLLTSHASDCNTMMVEFESGNTVERGC
ncbi:uncharacterized protein TNCV_354051 [Trichonephila clavipes]|uniref:Uncharacterized protein n=1 Tax=Trichonephila clavipes TaxID=2585209 RepID=A0A8X7BBX4_TRICX|nr:uncharacterized protein TNCV_354051 [Trichonephila clavipes]